MSQFQHGKLAGISDVHRTNNFILIHHADKGLDKVVHVTETASLTTTAIDGQVFALQCLHNEVRHHATVVHKHAGAVGVENAHNADIHLILAVVIHKEGFRHALALVVAAADTDGVHVSPVVLFLRMHRRVAIDLAGAGLQYAGMDPLGKS